MKIFDLRLLLGGVEGLPERILADGLAFTRENDASGVQAR
jgi:hypothetical protein